MFFVVSTGRSGTQSIANILSTSPNCVCKHEPPPVLINEAPFYHYGLFPHNQMIALLRCTRPATIKGKQYGESNQELSFVIPALDKAFPDCKFVWLVRDGRDTVASTYARDWYACSDDASEPEGGWEATTLPWFWFRLRGDLCKAMTYPEWEALTRWEKNCWRWTYINDVIANALKDIDGSRWMLLRIEGIRAWLPALCDLLGIDKPITNQFYHNVSASPPPHWTDWNAEQRVAFEKWCGKKMDTIYGKGWRGDWDALG